MAWSQSVITDAGAALLSASVAGTELVISSAVGGTGLTDEDDMKGMTQLHEQKQILSLTRLDRLDGATRIRFQIKNVGVSTAYQLQQVGIYGKLQGDSDETLLLVVQDETGVEIPAASTVEDFLVEMYVVVSITNEAVITIETDQAALVSQAEFNVLKAEIAETYLEKDAVVNNRTTTEEGFALDARQGKALQDGLDTLNSKIGSLITYRVVTSEAFETAANTSYNKGIAIPTVSGYTPIGVIRIGTNHPMLCAISQYSISGSNVWLAWRQFGGQSDQTWTLTILYVLTSALAN